VASFSLPPCLKIQPHNPQPATRNSKRLLAYFLSVRAAAALRLGATLPSTARATIQTQRHAIFCGLAMDAAADLLPPLARHTLEERLLTLIAGAVCRRLATWCADSPLSVASLSFSTGLTTSAHDAFAYPIFPDIFADLPCGAVVVFPAPILTSTVLVFLRGFDTDLSFRAGIVLEALIYTVAAIT